VLPKLAVHSIRRVQHVRMPSQWQQKQRHLHADSLPAELRGSYARGYMHPWCRLSCRGWSEYVRVPVERIEGCCRVHQAAVCARPGEAPASSTAAGVGRRRVLSAPVIHCLGWLQHLHMPSKWQEERGQVHADAVPYCDGASPAVGAVLSRHHLPRRRRLEHVPLPVERRAGGGHLYRLPLPKVSASVSRHAGALTPFLHCSLRVDVYAASPVTVQPAERLVQRSEVVGGRHQCSCMFCGRVNSIRPLVLV